MRIRHNVKLAKLFPSNIVNIQRILRAHWCKCPMLAWV